jgi:hypothetical protein
VSGNDYSPPTLPDAEPTPMPVQTDQGTPVREETDE